MSLENLSGVDTCNDNEYVFLAKIDNSKHIYNLLKTINFKDIATFFISENGVKVTVEDRCCMQGNAFIQSEIFQQFVVQEETVSFAVHLPTLLECLNIFGSGTSDVMTAMKMCYKGYGCPLILVLEEGGIVTDCKLHTQDAQDTLDFDFSAENVVNKIIMKSDVLKEVWGDLNTTSDTLEILISPNEPFFRLATADVVGDVQIDFGRDSESIELFQCRQTQTNRYRMMLLKPSLKALAASMKCSIRNDERGFLSLQYMIKMDENQTCFVEYMCSPEEDTTN